MVVVQGNWSSQGKSGVFPFWFRRGAVRLAAAVSFIAAVPFIVSVSFGFASSSVIFVFVPIAVSFFFFRVFPLAASFGIILVFQNIVGLVYLWNRRDFRDNRDRSVDCAVIFQA